MMEPKTREAMPPWIAPAALLAVALAMATLGWRRWPDPIVDFGRELFVAWRLSEGDVLQRDVAYLNGPLSPVWNAAWFRLLGPGIDVLAAVNALVLAAVVALFHRFLRCTHGALAALLGGVVLLAIFGLAQLVETGNYNFIAPYSHEMTHGLALSLVAIACLDGFARTGRRAALAGVGLALGAVFLTKPEIFAALVVAVAAGALALPRRIGAPEVGLVAAGSLVAPIVALLTLSASMPLREALGAVAGAWRGLLATDVSQMAFYRAGMGTDDIAGSLAKLASASLLWAIAFAPALGAAWLGRGPLRGRAWLPLASAAFVAAAGAALLTRVDWLALGRPLPLLVAALAVVAWRRRQQGERSAQLSLQLALVGFAAALLLKMVGNARLHHYGFVLAMPATLLAVATCTASLPDALTRRGWDGRSFRAAAMAVVGVFVTAHVLISAQHFRTRTFSVGAPPDALIVDAVRGPVLAEALAAIERRTTPDDRLVALPEGAMLGYLARRRSAIRHIVFTPFEFVVFGEDEIFAELRASPPDFIALVHRNTAEFGARFFGKHYGEPLFAWLKRRYLPVEQLGDPPLQAVDRFGIVLAERRDRAAAR